jgi:hypothetical protein
MQTLLESWGRLAEVKADPGLLGLDTLLGEIAAAHGVSLMIPQPQRRERQRITLMPTLAGAAGQAWCSRTSEPMTYRT